MRYIQYRNIRLYQIQIFLCAAECGNFTATAEQMHVTQPMVSKTIRTLEQELGILLFRKSHGKPCLTPAGRELRIYWERMMELFEASISNAHAVQEARQIPLRIGLGMSGDRKDIRKRLEALEQKDPSMNLIYECGDMAGLLERVAQGQLDLTICSGHLLPSAQRLRLKFKLLMDTPLAVFLPESHPLAKRKSLSFADLSSQPFIAFSPEADPNYWELLNSMAAEAGFRPQIGCYVRDERSFQVNLERGKGVVLADSHTFDVPGIKQFVLEGTSCGLYLVWDGENDNPVLGQLLRNL